MTNLLKVYYGDSIPQQLELRMNNLFIEINFELIDMEKNLVKLPAVHLNIIKKIKNILRECSTEAYFVGGVVRDLLRGEANNDIDIVINGDVKNSCLVLAAELEGKVNFNNVFQTGTVKLNNGYSIDLARMRREFYPSSGSLPLIEESGEIKEDLLRRDFTINTLLLPIFPEKRANIIDYLYGSKDLELGLLRTLHSFSFFDDPTRIIRGIRLADKMGFSFEKKTKKLIKETLFSTDFTHLSAVRVIKEFKLLFATRVSKRMFQFLLEFQVFNLLGRGIKIDEDLFEQITKLEVFLEYFQKKNYNIKEWLLRLAVFLGEVSESEIEEWGFTAYERKILTDKPNSQLLTKMNQRIAPEILFDLLEKLTIEELILILLRTEKRQIKDNLFYYLNRLKTVKLNINGFDLQKLGLTPGPEIKNVLKKVLTAKLRGKLINRHEELKYAEKIIKKRDWSD